MILSRLTHSKLFSAAVPVLFLLLAYLIDLAYQSFPDPSVGCIGIHRRCTLVHLALSALFVLAALGYVWFIPAPLTRRPLTIILSLTLGTTTIIYPILTRFVPFLNYYSLRTLPFIGYVHLQLSNSTPRSFLILAALLITLGLPLTLARSRRRGAS